MSEKIFTKENIQDTLEIGLRVGITTAMRFLASYVQNPPEGWSEKEIEAVKLIERDAYEARDLLLVAANLRVAQVVQIAAERSEAQKEMS